MADRPWKNAARFPEVRGSDRMTRWPKITVVTPSFNQGIYLEAALQSVILQEYPNLEYIVMDGGSTDGSLAIIEKYSEHLTYWQSERDGGQAAALRVAFLRATGDILCYLNSDDLLLPGAFFHVALLFERRRTAGVVYGNRLVIDEKSHPVGQHLWPRMLFEHHWWQGQFLAQESTFWKREVYEQVGGINSELFFIMDYDLFYRMWKISRFVKTRRFLGCLRLHPASKNANYQEIRTREIGQARMKYGIRSAGYFGSRLINRLDKMEISVEKIVNLLMGNPEKYAMGEIE
jgi:glycosyltransferase involved in cell wall biosynthesis